MRQALRKLLQDRRVKYVAVGAWNTLFSYLAFVALYLALSPLGVHYLLVLVLSQIVGVTNAYVCYKVFVFKTRGNVLKEYLRFYVVYGTTFVINIALITLFVEVFHLNAILSQGIIAAIVVVLAYFAHSNFSFKAE